jgi:hypothetical protein
MKKRRRVMIKRRKNGAATHVYLPIIVTLELIPYLFALHAYQSRMSVILIIVMIPLILLKYPFLMKFILAILVTLILVLMLLKIIMREENMVVGIFMLLKHLSLY